MYLINRILSLEFCRSREDTRWTQEDLDSSRQDQAFGLVDYPGLLSLELHSSEDVSPRPRRWDP